MCVGVPMRVIDVLSPGRAVCEHEGRHVAIDTLLVGTVAIGDWLMTFLGAARERMDEAAARRSIDAIAAVQAIMNGERADIESAFADLIGREPTLPPHLLDEDGKTA